jgi:nucleoside-diphosphate-sugar epimerase
VNALVTGAGGFLGLYLVEKLVARGDRVRAFCRGTYRELDALGVEVVRGDVRDRDAVAAACQGIDAAFHTAAIAGIGGRWRDFYAVNVAGTRSVVEGCRKHRVGRLVYTSSPSVTFDGSDQRGVDESTPYAARWLAHYPHSKALAEEYVLASNGIDGLLTCALRPHLIWGPRDRHLIPRLLRRARAGRLRRVGDGTNLVDMIYVENAADAHLAAADMLLGCGPARNSGLGARDSGVRSQDSGVRSQDSGVRSRESGVRSRESGVRSRESGVRSQESGVRSQEYGQSEIKNHKSEISPIPNPQSPISNPQSLIPNPQSLIPNPQSPIPNPQSPIPNSEPRVPGPESPAAGTAEPQSPAGRAYFLSQGEPVNCWQWIDQILALAGLPPVRKSISLRTARAIGAACEAVYGLLGLRGEPPMTRFLAAQLAASHYFDIGRARADFGYQPRISTAEGMRRLGDWLAAESSSRPGVV